MICMAISDNVDDARRMVRQYRKRFGLPGRVRHARHHYSVSVDLPADDAMGDFARAWCAGFVAGCYDTMVEAQ